jgi:large subunit ribosomal protein L1
MNYITKIEGGWVDVDVIIATPAVMPKIGKLGKVLGPRNLMPNPKTGTVTNDVAAAVNEVKGGKIAFKVDKAGIVHASIGRVSFASEKIAENSAGTDQCHHQTETIYRQRDLPERC